MELESKIKVIDELIKDEQEAADEYHKAIDKIKEDVSPCVLEMLGHIYEEEIRHISMLEDVKKRMQNHGLGDTYADEAFGMVRYY